VNLMNIFEFRGVSFSYPDDVEALKNVSLTIEAGRTTAIVGSNGAGKSTLLLHLNGILKPTKGEVLFNGKPIRYSSKELDDLRRRVQLVFQNPDDQLVSTTVRQDIAFGPKNLGLPSDEIERRVKEALNRIGMDGFERRSPSHLSVGQKKRVALAGVLAMRPEVFVLDEPLDALDSKGQEDMLRLMKEFLAKGKTLIHATYNVDQAYEWAEKVILLSEGSVLANGSPQDIFSDTELMEQAKLTPPKILDIYKTLKERHLVKERGIPRNKLELIDSLKI